MIITFVASESGNTLTGNDLEWLTVQADYIEMDRGICEVWQIDDDIEELSFPRLWIKYDDVIDIKDNPSKYDVISKISLLEAERLHIEDKS